MLNVLEYGSAEAVHFGHGVDMIVAQIAQRWHIRGHFEFEMEQLAVEKEGSIGHNPGQWHAAGIVGQRRRLDALHEQRGQVHAAQIHPRKLMGLNQMFQSMDVARGAQSMCRARDYTYHKLLRIVNIVEILRECSGQKGVELEAGQHFPIRIRYDVSDWKLAVRRTIVAASKECGKRSP